MSLSPRHVPEYDAGSEKREPFSKRPTFFDGYSRSCVTNPITAEYGEKAAGTYGKCVRVLYDKVKT